MTVQVTLSPVMTEPVSTMGTFGMAEASTAMPSRITPRMMTVRMPSLRMRMLAVSPPMIAVAPWTLTSTLRNSGGMPRSRRPLEMLVPGLLDPRLM